MNKPPLDEQIAQKKKELELLELSKREEQLKIEIETIKHTKVEETVIERRIIYRDEYVPTPGIVPYWKYSTNPYKNDLVFCGNTAVDSNPLNVLLQ
jgi:hypothetical protein